MIFKIKKINPPYTQIHNNIIDNPGLSGKAKWILIYLLSKPADWQVYELDVENHCTDGRDSIRTGINELIKAGYIKRDKQRDEITGQFKGYEYEVHELPIKSGISTENGLSDLGKSDISNTKRTKDEISRDKELNHLEKRKTEEELWDEMNKTGYGITKH